MSTVSFGDRAHLVDLGMTEQRWMSFWVDERHGQHRGRKSARKYLERYVDYKGNISVPVLMFHNIEDPLAPVEATDAYYETLAAKGKEDFLTRVYTNRPGHCNFTPAQVLAIFQAMDGWLDTEIAPSADAFPDGLDLVFGSSRGPGPNRRSRWPEAVARSEGSPVHVGSTLAGEEGIIWVPSSG